MTDPARVNPELGGEAAREALVKALHERGMGLLLDIVPNHMAASHENPYWQDVLANGRASAWARWFDIDWHAPDEELRGRVLLPVLGAPLRDVIARGELTVVPSAERGVSVAYYDNRFPLDPQTIPRLFTPTLEAAIVGADGAGRPALERFRTVLDRLAALPPRRSANAGAVERRRAEVPALLAEFEAVRAGEGAVRDFVASALDEFATGENGANRLRALLDRQPYRLAFWRRAAAEINYRRFFNINELVALAMEDAPVFEATHRLVLQWVADGGVDGLRIDHIDGLRDPLVYLQRLRRAVDERRPPVDGGGPTRRFPILVEKILSPDEPLRPEWPVEGTTGYEVLNDLEAVFIDADGYARLERHYRRLLRLDRRGVDFDAVALASKRRVLGASLAADVERLLRLLLPIARRDPRTAVVPTDGLRAAIVEVMTRLPVYRTYVDTGDRGDDGSPRAMPADVGLVDGAIAAAAGRPGVPPTALALLREVLLLDGVDGASEVEARDRRRFASRFQQISGPAAAKGVEDTALYLYAPLASRNEVGADPARPLDDAVDVLHLANEIRARDWPGALVCTSTHDTKRGADTRSRLDVLSELPEEWWATVTRWRRLNAPIRARVGRRTAPDANTEYLLYQTMVAIWPTAASTDAGGDQALVPDADGLAELRQRVTDYMRKAVREGKSRSSWVQPDEAFEAALDAFIEALHDPARSRQFLDELAALAARVAAPGRWNALARTLLHLTVPGVPDLYQGDELWQPTLVDPDNRRPVDFDRRRALLAELRAGGTAQPRRVGRCWRGDSPRCRATGASSSC